MSVLEAQRKKRVAEEERKRERKKAEEEQRIRDEQNDRREQKVLGPTYPKVWDLNYIREEAQKIFMKKRDDNLDGDFFKFKIYVNETDYFSTNFYENLEDLKWKNTEKVKDIRKGKFNINENFFNAVAIACTY